MRQAAERNVRFCHLRSALRRPQSVYGAGPFWSEAVLLRAPGQPVRLRFGDQGACCKCPALRPNSTRNRLHQYLTFLWVPDPQTMFRGILKLPAGHYAVWQRRPLELTKYWDLTFPPAGATYARSEGRAGGRNSGAFPPFGGRPDGQRCSHWRLSQRGAGFFQHCGHDGASRPAAGAHLHHYVSAQISGWRERA